MTLAQGSAATQELLMQTFLSLIPLRGVRLLSWSFLLLLMLEACGGELLTYSTGIAGAAGGVGFAGASGASGSSAGVAGSMTESYPLPPRPLAPMSTSTVTSQTPSFHWELAAGTDGAQVEICADHACTNVIESFLAMGVSGKPSQALPAGAYFWRLAGTNQGVVGTSYSPTWEVWVGHRSAPVDTSWGTTLDVNADGYADMLLGKSSGSGSMFILAGEVDLYLGSAEGITQNPSLILSPPMPGDLVEFGSTLGSAGDVNGDGYDDVFAGSVTGAYVYLGSAQGIGSTPSLTLTTAPSSLSSMIFYVSAAGDVNGDGYADLLVNVPGDSTHPGASYLYLGSSTGLSSTPSVTWTGNTEGFFWSAVSWAGDLNGDGFGDILVSQALSNGRIEVYLGSPRGISETPSMVLGQRDPASTFGLTLSSAGDVNGDGYADILIGATVQSMQLVYIYLGGPTGVSASPAFTLSIVGPAYALFSMDTATAGDVNGDGYGDLIVGVVSDNNLQGDAFIYLGSPAFSTSAAVHLSGPPGSLFGSSVAGLGDINGDGFADVASLASGDVSQDSLGWLSIYEGSAQGVPIVPTTTILDPTGALFGGTVESLSIGASRGPRLLR